MRSSPDSASQGRLLRAPGRAGLGLVFCVVLLDVVGLTILDPIAPYIVRRYSADALALTALSSVYAAAQFVSAPILGRLSDRAGRRPVLLICVLGSALGYFIFGIGGALWVLFLGRLVDGITGGNMSVATAYVMDVSAPAERAQNMTLVGTAMGLGFVLGPATAGLLGQAGANAPIWAAGAISLLAAALIFFGLPESVPPERRRQTRLLASELSPFGAVGAMLAKPGLAPILAASALFGLAFDGVTGIGGLFVMRRFAAQPWQVGSFFAAAGIANAIMQAFVTRRLIARFGERLMAIIGLIGTGAGAAFVAFAPSLWWLYPNAFLQSAATGFAWATLPAMAANRVPEGEQGELAGVSGAVGGLMAMIGPLWAGAVYDHVGAGAPFLAGAALFLAAGLALGRA